ncbi:zinc finger protein 260-like [Mercenaria mercenaria]|uniref:zinc finger protein 260-like n=1 Tax=Mercenaria mercenaria TaxID=6596 RepID=UPI00234F7229|nr:zinc finger protein 260-like [Mercenaria mercenaria]
MATAQDIIDAGLATVAAEYEVSMSKSEEEKPVVRSKKQRIPVDRVFRQDGTVEIDKVEVDSDVEIDEIKEENEGMYYICQVCAKPFDSKKDVELHLATQECKGMEKEVKEMYECGECKVLCSSMNSLASHMMVHKQKVIVVRHGLNEHLTRVGYTCTTCHKVLGSKGNLAKHQIIHMGVKPYKCSFCNKEFSLKGNRDKHELIHTDKRAHQCQICSKKFTLKGNLQQHILTHSTVKFFRCYLCDKEFTLKGNLDKHIKRHANGLPVQKVSNKSESSRRTVVSSDGNEDGKQQVSGSVKSFNIKIDGLIGSLKAKIEHSQMETEDFDEIAEGEEMNEYIQGVVIDDNTAEEQVVETEEDAEANENGDIVQNL